MSTFNINKDTLYSIIFGEGLTENFTLEIYGKTFEFVMGIGNFSDLEKESGKELLVDSIISINDFRYDREEIEDLLKKVPTCFVEVLYSCYQELLESYLGYLSYLRDNIEEVLRDPKFSSTLKIFRSFRFKDLNDLSFKKIISNPISYTCFIYKIQEEEKDRFEENKAFIDRLCSFIDPKMMEELTLSEEGKKDVEKIRRLLPMIKLPDQEKDEEIARLAHQFLDKKGLEGEDRESAGLDVIKEGGDE